MSDKSRRLSWELNIHVQVNPGPVTNCRVLAKAIFGPQLPWHTCILLAEPSLAMGIQAVILPPGYHHPFIKQEVA